MGDSYGVLNGETTWEIIILLGKHHTGLLGLENQDL